MDLLRGARKYLAARDAAAAADAAAKAARAEMARAEAEMIEAMLSSGVTGIKIDGLNIGTRVSTHATIRAADRDTAHEWLRKNGYGDKITETISPSTLSAIVRNIGDVDGERPEIPGVTVYEAVKASVRK